MKEKLRFAVLGAGHLGKVHIGLLQQLDNVELVGFYDPHEPTARLAAKQLGLERYASMGDLIAKADAVDIVTPTSQHFECASQAIVQGRHVFIEKPLAGSLRQAETLCNMARKAGVKAQVGHVERFNPAFAAAKGRIGQPLFIEAHRLAQFNPRGTDVSVVLDLMIHDLDIILSIVPSPVAKIHANGVAVLSQQPDIANVRLEFENGCVANITASRLSMKNMRKTRIFQQDAYIGMDFLEKTAEIVTISGQPPPETAMHLPLDLGGATRYVVAEQMPAGFSNAMLTELRMFAECIANDTPEAVPIEDGLQALRLAFEISQTIEKNISVRKTASPHA